MLLDDNLEVMGPPPDVAPNGPYNTWHGRADAEVYPAQNNPSAADAATTSAFRPVGAHALLVASHVEGAAGQPTEQEFPWSVRRLWGRDNSPFKRKR
jgi:hypothetical protein